MDGRQQLSLLLPERDMARAPSVHVASVKWSLISVPFDTLQHYTINYDLELWAVPFHCRRLHLEGSLEEERIRRAIANRTIRHPELCDFSHIATVTSQPTRAWPETLESLTISSEAELEDESGLQTIFALLPRTLRKLAINVNWSALEWVAAFVTM
ncbi:hypothetical protein AMAG_19679 [Allomyces macrogynus ATCC 38327]|uniref:Uncharacterized protein n=1 Tax=Allomyces macrogynus (strain ATCC 38327) TaxID=578462 RepID=A0A0L0SY22_ALLM3|nr:hypothetical protein AMAG_19679 [Allomyces macrogynus ATCC 38327]|eukprot:KNE67295.1 hypothetical protein AMAG_19679 [Allomyces macrogynus ATCC 38327]